VVELARLSDGKIIAEKVKEKLDLVAQITGLDFGRFTKSMLLSQGQFAAFLNANPNERAELLEELTGTEIYGDISKQVFAQFKQAKSALQLMQAKAQGMELLTDGQKAQRQEQLTSLSLEEATTSSQLNALQIDKQWLDRQQKVVLAHKNAVTDEQAAIKEQQTQQTLLDRLEQSQPAENLRLIQETLLKSQAAVERSCESQHALQLQLDSNAVQVTALTKQFNEAEQTAESFKQNQLQTEEVINEQVVPLDNQITQLKTEQNRLQQQFKQQNSQRDTLLGSQGELNQQHQGATAGLFELSQYFAQNPMHGSLTQQLGIWQERFTWLTNQRATLQQNQNLSAQHLQTGQQLDVVITTQFQHVEHHQTIVTRAKQAFDNANLVMENLVKHSDETKINEQLAKLTNLKPQMHQLQTLFNSNQQLQVELSKATISHQGDLVKYNELKQQLDIKLAAHHEKYQHLQDLHKLLEQEKTIVSLTQARADLQANDPCPLCGSTEHPAIESYQALNISQTEQRYNQLKHTVEALSSLTQSLQTELAKLDVLLQSEQSAMTKLHAQIEQTHQDWLQSCATLVCVLDINELSVLNDFIAQKQHQEQQLQEQLAQYKQASQQVFVAHNELSEATNVLQQTSFTLSSSEKERENLETTQKSLEAMIVNLSSRSAFLINSGTT
jgi:exonuclease SbcC